MWFWLHLLVAFGWCFVSAATLGEFLIGLLLGFFAIVVVARTFGIRYELQLMLVCRLMLLSCVRLPLSTIQSYFSVNRPSQIVIYKRQNNHSDYDFLFALLILCNTQACVLSSAQGNLKLESFCAAYQVPALLHTVKKLENDCMTIYGEKHVATA